MTFVKFTMLLINLLLFSQGGICQIADKQERKDVPLYKNLDMAKEMINRNLEDSALTYLNAILERKIDHKEALSLRAKIYNNNHQLGKALSDYNAVISLDPNDIEVLYARGILRYQLSQYERSIEDFEKVLSLPAGETQTAFFKISEGNGGATGIATITGLKADIWNNIGLCYFAMGAYEQAIFSYSRGIEIDQGLLDLYVNRALALEKSGKTEDARTDYKSVISKDPNHSIARYNLLNLQQDQSQTKDLLESLNAFIEENPTFAHGYSSRGLYHFESNDYTSALVDFKKALDILPENTDYLFNLGLCYEKLNEFESAEQLFYDVLTLEPTHGGAYFNLGNIQFKQGAFEEAISFYTLANHHNPQNASIIYNRALAYFEKKMMDKACEDMERVMKLDPSLGSSFYAKHCITNQ